MILILLLLFVLVVVGELFLRNTLLSDSSEIPPAVNLETINNSSEIPPAVNLETVSNSSIDFSNISVDK